MRASARNPRRVERPRRTFACRRVSNLCHNAARSVAALAVTCAFAPSIPCERRESNLGVHPNAMTFSSSDAWPSKFLHASPNDQRAIGAGSERREGDHPVDDQGRFDAASVLGYGSPCERRKKSNERRRDTQGSDCGEETEPHSRWVDLGCVLFD